MRIDQVKEVLEGLAKGVFVENGSRFWFARDLVEVAGAGEWCRMRSWIRNAMFLCSSGNEAVESHFRAVGRIVFEDGGQLLCVDDVQMTGYACYLAGVAGAGISSRAALVAMHFYISSEQDSHLVFEPLPEPGCILIPAA
ncbi:MAG TPA: hypothetical protein PLD82_06340 [Spirochaetota bacterium]|nr:hypothetical protein [Spirochaetota bacterium]HPH01671.1 hypothetical protein [Spirochaetota bacterium]